MYSLFGCEQLLFIQMDYNMNITTDIKLKNIHVLMDI